MNQEIRKKKVFSIGNYLFTGTTLGKGNFARVEEAVHTVLNVKVAIKIMDVNHIKEEYVIKNLYREAKIMTKLNHPCIVSLFQTMQRADNVYYIVTELANGGDLCSFVKRQAKGRLEEKVTKVYARQFVSALSHMHSLGVVHRDLKMDNVMLNSIQTQIKIVDFGLSNIWTSDSPLKTHCGSPEYAAPELFITGKLYGSEVDLWSFGIILYGMVLGQLPFVTSCSQQHSSQERRKQLVAQINRGLSTVHRRALSPFSSDFRSLMNRLLVSDASKRIAMKELMVHPWITDKGNRMIRTNPLKSLDSYDKNKLYGKISAILQMDPKQVSTSVMQEPLGRVGGVYNILKRKFQLSQIHGDGASKTMPSLKIFELANISKNAEKDKNRNPKKVTKPQSAQLQKTSKGYVVTNVPSTESKVSERTAPDEEPAAVITVNQSRIRKKYIVKSRPMTVQDAAILKEYRSPEETKPRPITVQTVEQKKGIVDYRYIKSPSLRRKIYSASINNKNNVTVSSSRKTDEAEKPSKPGQSEFPGSSSNVNIEKEVLITKSCERDTKEQPQLDRPVIKKKIKQLLHIKDSPPKNPLPTKSEQSHVRHTFATPFQQILDKPLKATAGISTGGKISAKKKDSREQNLNMAFGDFVTAKSGKASSQKRLAIYDPIAKSIADYVANNVSDKINRYPWLKK